MAKVTTTIDDMSGAELNEDVEPTTITVDGTDYTVDLGSASKEHLIRWLSGDGPYALRSAPSTRQTPRRAAAASDDSKEERAAARHWAIETGFEYPSQTEKDKDGNPVMKRLGDRGRIPEAVMKAWREAGSPGIGQ